jgi:hypothetical protein
MKHTPRRGYELYIGQQASDIKELKGGGGAVSFSTQQHI